MFLTICYKHNHKNVNDFEQPQQWTKQKLKEIISAANKYLNNKLYLLNSSKTIH